MEQVKKSSKKRIIIIVITAIIIIASILTILTIIGKKYEFFSHGSIPYYSVEDMKTKAPVIVQGEVINISEPFLVEDSQGVSVRAYRDFEVKVSKALRGTPGDIVTVRIAGGEFGNVSFVEEPTPKLEENKEYILFIYQHHMGGGTLTEGDYYFILGEQQGVYKNIANTKYAELRKNSDLYLREDFDSIEGKNAKSAISIVEENESGITEEVIKLSSFEKSMESFNKEYPANEFWFREDVLASREANLEEGMITQEEYDRYTVRAEEYGRIMTKKETDEYLNMIRSRN